MMMTRYVPKSPGQLHYIRRLISYLIALFLESGVGIDALDFLPSEINACKTAQWSRSQDIEEASEYQN